MPLKAIFYIYVPDTTDILFCENLSNQMFWLLTGSITFDSYIWYDEEGNAKPLELPRGDLKIVKSKGLYSILTDPDKNFYLIEAQKGKAPRDVANSFKEPFSSC